MFCSSLYNFMLSKKKTWMYEFLEGSHYKFYLWYLAGSLVDLSGYIGKHWLHMLDVGMCNCSWPPQDSALLWPLCHTHPLTPVRHNWQAVPWDLSLPHTVPDLCLQTFHFTFQVTVSSCRRDSSPPSPNWVQVDLGPHSRMPHLLRSHLHTERRCLEHLGSLWFKPPGSCAQSLSCGLLMGTGQWTRAIFD